MKDFFRKTYGSSKIDRMCCHILLGMGNRYNCLFKSKTCTYINVMIQFMFKCKSFMG